MKTTSTRRLGNLAAVLAPAALLAACSGGGGGGASAGDFFVSSITVPDGAIWPINKRIEIQFSDEVDLNSVIAGSTIQLKSTDGSGASAFYDVGYDIDAGTGSVDRTKLVIQPFCPLLADFSDAGLQPGNVAYELFLPKGGGGSTSITSLKGAQLDVAQTRAFRTPDSLLPAAVFDDTQVGPPAFVQDMSFVRLGDGSEIPFVENGLSFDLPSILPLNLYSDSESRVEFLVQMNQAVDPAADNLSDERVRIEYLDSNGEWQPFDTIVELEANCVLDKPGAILRLTPFGILPQDTQLRVTIVAGFSDLVGEQNLSDQTDFFADTSELSFASLTPTDGGADEVYEDFMISGVGSTQDVDASFDTPPAVWGDGQLSAAFDFVGTGGPGGNFDWHTPTGTQNFDTNLQLIVGGPDGVPTTQVQVVNGVVDVDDLIISAGTFLRVQAGDNPLTIFATGTVRIDGIIDASGFDAINVGTLFTPNQQEVGALGAAGGGTGGTGSFLTSASTPSGGVGSGPFGLLNAGGKGGEAGFSETTDKQKRRGAGGGGATFGPTVTGLGAIPEGFSLVSTMGDQGHPEGLGGITKLPPPIGGLPGDGPFQDSSAENDFFGQRALYTDGNFTGVLTGELGLRWAGYGGGAGGDSVQADDFPTVPFGPPYKDKKGCGGGGGGGQIRIVALGPIIFGPGGRILCNGGDGGTGENVLGYDHIAGSSGGGSGGHIMLESATQVDFTNEGLNQVSEQYVQAYGADGGIPYLPAVAYSGGGSGGPGIVQIHVPDPNPDTAIGTAVDSAIRVPLFSNISDVTRPPAQVLIPSFGARSKGRSQWLPLGGAAVAPGGGFDPVLFAFEGTDDDDLSATTGEVLTTGESVDSLAPILGPETLGTAAPSAFVDSDGYTLVLSAGSLAPLITDTGTPSLDIYLRNPSLLTNFQLRLESGTNAKEFDVQSATYADAGQVLRVVADTSSSTLQSFIDQEGGNPADISYELIPRYFRVQSGLVKDFLPDTSYVKVLFRATGADAQGNPETDPIAVDWTSDISEFNSEPAGSLQFFQWEVEFNLATGGSALTVDTVPTAIDFIRAPFSF